MIHYSAIKLKILNFRKVIKLVAQVNSQSWSKLTPPSFRYDPITYFRLHNCSNIVYLQFIEMACCAICNVLFCVPM